MICTVPASEGALLNIHYYYHPKPEKCKLNGLYNCTGEYFKAEYVHS